MSKKKTLAKASNQIIANFFSFILPVILLCYFMLHMLAAHTFHTSFPSFFDIIYFIVLLELAISLLITRTSNFSTNN
jgi:formate hydrogenlyase subunit 4